VANGSRRLTTPKIEDMSSSLSLSVVMEIYRPLGSFQVHISSTNAFRLERGVALGGFGVNGDLRSMLEVFEGSAYGA